MADILCRNMRAGFTQFTLLVIFVEQRNIVGHGRYDPLRGLQCIDLIGHDRTPFCLLVQRNGTACILPDNSMSGEAQASHRRVMWALRLSRPKTVAGLQPMAAEKLGGRHRAFARRLQP